MNDPDASELFRKGVNFALAFLDFHDVCLNEFGDAIAGAALMFIEAEGFKLVRIDTAPKIENGFGSDT